MAKKVSEFPRAIVDLDDTISGQKWMIYSNPGIGKTVLGGQLPDVLFIASDPGIHSVLRRSGPPRGLRKIWMVKDWNEFADEVFPYLEDGDHPFKWIFFDSITKAREMCLRSVSAWRYDTDQKVKAAKAKSDRETPELRDYLMTQEKIKAMVTDFNNLTFGNPNVNIMWAANVLNTSDEEGDDLVMPLIPGKGYEVAQYVCADMDVVGYYSLRQPREKGPEYHRLLIQPQGPYFAKNRFDTMKNGKLVRYVDIAKDFQPITSMDKVVDFVYGTPQQIGA